MGIIILLLVVIFNLIIILYCFKVPKRDSIDTSYLPKSYCIQTLNRIDIQNKYECAAFSSAFILRHLGEEADGNELYKGFPRKLLDGTINPKGIIIFFKRRGLDASYLSGNVNTLKKRLTQGVPVILFIKVFPNKRYLHFVPIIGYDDKYFYLADSLKQTINCDEVFYNRKLLISELEALWKTWLPFSKNSYIVVHSNRWDVEQVETYK